MPIGSCRSISWTYAKKGSSAVRSHRLSSTVGAAVLTDTVPKLFKVPSLTRPGSVSPQKIPVLYP